MEFLRVNNLVTGFSSVFPPILRREALHLRDLREELHQPPQHEAASPDPHGREAVPLRRLRPTLPLLQHAQSPQGEMFPSQQPFGFGHSCPPTHRQPGPAAPWPRRFSPAPAAASSPSTDPPSSSSPTATPSPVSRGEDKFEQQLGAPTYPGCAPARTALPVGNVSPRGAKASLALYPPFLLVLGLFWVFFPFSHPSFSAERGSRRKPCPEERGC